jgi:hypothetical protein
MLELFERSERFVSAVEVASAPKEPANAPVSYLSEVFWETVARRTGNPRRRLVFDSASFSLLRQEVTMKSMLMAIAVLSLSWMYASGQTVGQTVQTDSPTASQTDPDRAKNSSDEQGTVGQRAPDGDNSPTSDNRPVRDETVGLGSAVDRAPRDIREPFDE